MKFFCKGKNENIQEEIHKESEKQRLTKIFEDLTNLLKFLEKGDFTAKPKFPEAFTGQQEPIMKYALGMIGNLTKLIRKVKQGFQEIQNHMGQIGNSTEELAEATSKCFDETCSLEDSSIQIASGVEQTAQKSKKIADTCASVGEEIRQVTVDIKAFNEVINRIDECAKELMGVANSIESISKETNLLSLNAQIEAARAGEAGKGFAVIAGELGKLNEKTSSEAKKSTEIIKKIFEPIAKGEEQINRIMEESLNIQQGANLIVGETKEIADTTNEQATLVENATNNIHAIKLLLEKTATSSQQSAASSQEIISEIEQLKAILEIFKVNR